MGEFHVLICRHSRKLGHATYRLIWHPFVGTTWADEYLKRRHRTGKYYCTGCGKQCDRVTGLDRAQRHRVGKSARFPILQDNLTSRYGISGTHINSIESGSTPPPPQRYLTLSPWRMSARVPHVNYFLSRQMTTLQTSALRSSVPGYDRVDRKANCRIVHMCLAGTEPFMFFSVMESIKRLPLSIPINLVALQ